MKTSTTRRRVDEHKTIRRTLKKQKELSNTMMLYSILHRLLLPTRRRRPPSSPHGVAFFYLLPSANPSPPRSLSSSNTATASIAPNPQTLTFLIDSCGLSPESAIVAARKLPRLRSPENPSAVLRLFREYGLGDADVSRIITTHPALLSCDSGRILRPKLEALRGFGFSGKSLARILATEPVLLTRSLEKHIVPCLTFLRALLSSDGGIVSVFARHPRALNADLNKSILPVVRALRERGLPEGRISKMVKITPDILVLGPRRVDEIVDDLKAAGVLPSDPLFTYAFCAVAGQKRAHWDRKMAAFKALGLSEADAVSAFRRRPWVMALSEEKIRRGLDFFLNRLKLSPDVVVRHPILLCYSLEKRILPRCAVMSVLKTKGKLEESSSAVSALLAATSLFLRSYVMRYQDHVPEVLKAYNGEIEFQGLK